MSTVRSAGPHGWLLELVEPGQPAAVAAGLTAQQIPGLREIVPGHQTLLLVWDGPRPSAAVAAGLVAAVQSEPVAARQTVPFAIPVRYDGPDLAAVAVAAGCSAEEVVRRHVAPDYQVAFLGFAPGFAYLTGGDPILALPRRAEPRTLVPAGAVAVAGDYSAVYPRSSPGGWHLIGQTDVVLFDPARSPPSPLAAGMTVRFEVARR